MNYPQQIIDYALDVIFPVNCLGCGRFSPKNRKEYVCKSCLRLIPFRKNMDCIGCGRNSSLGKTCINCRENTAVEHLFAVFNYKEPLLERILKTFKYRFVHEIAECLHAPVKKYILWLNKEKGVNLATDNPIIIPVPLHPRRLNWRGFNQSEIIAKIISDATHLDISTCTLIRSGSSKPQAEIKDEVERLKNIKNKFNITSPENIKNRAVILVDDICTTGATLKNAAEVLKANGALKIIGLVIARG